MLLKKTLLFSRIKGYVEDSGEGRWTILQAIEASVPAPVLALSLFQRFRSRETDSFLRQAYCRPEEMNSEVMP